MSHRPLLSLTVALAGLLAVGESALAQSAACQRYRAELASLGSGGSRGAGAARQQRAEIARLAGYYHSIGCTEGGFFGPPSECGAIAGRIQAMQANYGRLAGQADDTGARRRQLLAAIQQACQPQREARLEVKPPRAPVEKASIEKVAEEKPRRMAAERRGRDEDDRLRRGLGGGRLVYARACDGFFFPLTSAPEGHADAMCQALCPGAQAAAYSMPNGEDAALDRAVSLKGKPYARLASAFKFQKGVDASCSCKGEGQTWAQALARAEVMLKRRPGDIVVTAQKAEELSRPKIALAAKRGRDKAPKAPLDVETTGSVQPSQAATPSQATPAQAAAAKASEPTEAAKPESVALVPTASRASSGIGPKSIEGVKVIPRTEGPKREVTDDQGVTRTVRIVAPNVIPVPAQVQAATP